MLNSEFIKSENGKTILLDHAYRSFVLGADPEFFFTINKKIVGSEKVLRKISMNRIVEDGVQAEIHPPQICLS